jgi:hypothetical protein
MNSAIEAIIPVVAIIFTFGIPGVIIFWAIQSKHRERMKLIDKGLTPEEVRAYFADAEKKPKNPYSTLKWGILFLFLGVGFFIANILEYTMEIGEDFMPALLMFFGGAAFIVYYLIVKSKTNGASANASVSVNTSARDKNE